MGNALSLTGSYGSTLVGLEYERKLGDFGLGIGLGALNSRPVGANGILRCYVNFFPRLKPHLGLPRAS